MNRDDLGEAGREVWDAAHSTKWAASQDEGAVFHLAKREDEAAQLYDRIQCDGPVRLRPIVSPRGDVVGEEWVAHPLIGELRKLDAVTMKLRASLGLDPESRAKIGLDIIAPDERPDRLDLLGEKRRKRLAAVRSAS